ncbi:MAG: sulfatase-like hydrolase/transferase, partial [Gammaproteobacteria bacterium]|nr:sulfatase-like hydrolase/transferase [Gammaproteobacteria bacterium]
MKAGSLVVGLFVALMLPASSCAEAARRPNILLLVAEDLSPRIGAYGDAVASTPNLDQLAQRSVRFTHAFTTAGVCAPSRAALIMGQHQISFGAQHMRTSSGPLGEYYAQPDPDLKAFPEL